MSTEDDIVAFEAMLDYILPEIISHYPELTLKYYDTLLCVWPYTQTFWTMKRRNPNHWKLDSYLQMKPLRHSPDKKVFTNQLKRPVVGGREQSVYGEGIMKVWMKKFVTVKTFVSIPRDMLGRSKNMDNAILYESVFEKPDMWRIDGVPFSESSGLGKDVYGIVQRYLKKT
ncbi:hypothetical protein TNCV_4476591 [Trichonephila clavipes]|nr:hypothetical protein TNCV_4476591 [Trichonephila clavipes]